MIKSYLSRLVAIQRLQNVRFLSKEAGKEQKAPDNRIVHIEKQFDAIPPIERNKETFMSAIVMFKEKRSRNHVEFINSAIRYVKEYGVHKDIETYKALLNIFPKGKMIPQTTFQKIFLHYPIQQNCCVKLLDEMEWHGEPFSIICLISVGRGVQPDKEIHDIVVNAFGEWNFATKKVKRMLYWMPKLKHSNKYLDRRQVEGKTLSLAKLSAIALKMMARDPGTKIAVLTNQTDTEQSIDSEWIVSAQSIQQKNIINRLPEGTEIFIDGPHLVYVMDKRVQYIVMTCLPINSGMDEFKNEDADEDFSRWFEEWETRRKTPIRTVHEQRHETVLAMCAMHTNNNRMATKWVKHLQGSCLLLSKMNIRFRLDKGRTQSAYVDEADAAQKA